MVEWQISNEQSFTQILQEGKSAESETFSNPLLSGSYHIRIRGLTRDGKISAWSKTNSVSLFLEAQKTVPLQTPRFASSTFKFDPALSAQREPATIASPTISWTRSLGAALYSLQISRDKSFSSPLTMTTKENSLSWKSYRPGRWYLRVAAESQDKTLTPWSPLATLEVNVGNPVLNPIQPILMHGNSADKKAPPHDVSLSWTGISIADKYRLEVATTDSFKDPMVVETQTNFIKFTLPESGRYFARVKALEASGGDLTGFSNIQQIVYTFETPLEAPKLVDPFDRATIFLQADVEPFMWLEWKPVEGAQKYKVEVSSRPDFQKVILSKEISENRLLIKERLPFGRLFWRVKALSDKQEKNSVFSQHREFRILHGKNEVFVK
ncbi:MAG: hypothetical protein N2578_04325 [Bdellovibrionaceae bacterium]|nr:hypothetical protein [Pseudobdellovibrionaceae bacterium]